MAGAPQQLWPLPTVWRIILMIKLVTVGAGMVSLIFNPSFYVTKTWQIEADPAMMSRIYALVYQFAITSTATFVVFLALITLTTPRKGQEQERVRLICFFLVCGCLIDICSFGCTVYIYCKDKLAYNWSTVLSMFLDLVWMVIEGYFVKKFYSKTY